MELFELNKIKDYSVMKHSSGLDLIFYSNKSIRKSVYLGVRVGAFTNNNWLAGTAHFIEHYIFDSNNNDETLFSETGGMANAFTDKHKTIFYFESYNHFEENLQILLKTVFQPEFSQEKLEKNRNLILRELELYLQPENIIQNRCYENLLGKESTLKNDIVGTSDTILKMSLNSIIRFYERYYQPGNMFLILVGDIIQSDAVKCVDDCMKNHNYSGNLMKENFKITIPDQSLKFSKIHKILTRNDGFQFSYFLKRTDNKLYYKLIFEILNNYILGNSSNLFFEIEESQSLFSMNYETEILMDYIVVNISGIAANKINIFEILLSSISNIENNMTYDDFIRNKRSIAAFYLSGLEDTMQIVDFLSMCLDYGITIRGFFELLENIKYNETINICLEIIKKENFIIDIL